MKASSYYISLLHSNYTFFSSCQNFYFASYRCYNRSPYEDSMIRFLPYLWYEKVRFKRFTLPTKRISVHFYVQYAKQGLASCAQNSVPALLSKKYQSRTCAKCWQTFLQPIAQPGQSPIQHGERANCCALSSWQNYRIYCINILRCLYQHHFTFFSFFLQGLFNSAYMLLYISLNSQHSDSSCHSGFSPSLLHSEFKLLCIHAEHRFSLINHLLCFCNYLCVIPVCCCKHYCSCPFRRVFTLEYTRAYKYTVAAKLHHQSSICRCGNSSSCKVNHGEPAQSGSFYNQLVGNLQLPCNSHQLLLVSILVDSSYPSYFIINYPHMLDSFCNISSSRFPLCPYHRRSFRDPPESFPQVSCSTDKR